MYLFEFLLKQGGGTGGWYYPLFYNFFKKIFQKKYFLIKIFKIKNFKKNLKIKSEFNIF